MDISKEVMLKVTEVLKNQETVEKMNQTSSVKEAYEIACEHMEGVSLEDFSQILSELGANDGRIELSEKELDVVAGGAVTASHVKVTGEYSN